jgi:hypothetical protein
MEPGRLEIVDRIRAVGMRCPYTAGRTGRGHGTPYIATQYNIRNQLR